MPILHHTLELADAYHQPGLIFEAFEPMLNADIH